MPFTWFRRKGMPPFFTFFGSKGLAFFLSKSGFLTSCGSGYTGINKEKQAVFFHAEAPITDSDERASHHFLRSSALKGLPFFCLNLVFNVMRERLAWDKQGKTSGVFSCRGSYS
jgi:hypothetical protein